MTNRVDQLRTREADLEQQMDRLLELVEDYQGPTDALGLEYQLNRIVGQWRAQLVLRDRFLYRPAMDTHPPVAADCRQRMDALAHQVEDFARRWSSSALISIAFPSFRATAPVLVATIAARFEAERALLGETVGGTARLVA